MFEVNSRSYRVLTASLIYLVAIAAALIIATLRSRAKQKTPAETESPTAEIARRPAGKPFFSLSTHRTFGTADNARLWVDYQGVDHLDFRVYQVKDPRKFFTDLKNPHQMGEQEEQEVASSLPGIDDVEMLQPRRLYERSDRVEEYRTIVKRLNAERRDFLAKYPGLRSEIVAAVTH